jgi:hypothetical protein
MQNLIYQPIRSLANLIPFNARIRAAYTAINEIIARLDAIEGIAPVAETVADTESQTIIEPETVAETVQTDEITDTDTIIAWKSLDNADDLKAFASTIGCEIPGTVKKVETIKEKIQAHLDAQTED